jgi:pimeloyl-ACP methyl ester carboxylesterase
MKKNQLLRVATSDGLYLHGYYVPSENKKVAVLYVHGFESNFYEDYFVFALADELEENGIGFLATNNRGNSKDTDFKTTNGTVVRIGGYYELLEEAHLDITPWLKYLLDEGYEEIVLMGHSLGTMKVVRYLFEGELKDKINKLILLAPFDKKGFYVAQNMDFEKMLSQSEQMVAEGRGDEFVPPEFGEGPTSFNTFVSWYKQDELGRMFEFCNPNYDFPILKQIHISTKIIVGSKDIYFHSTNLEHPEEAMSLLLKNIPDAKGEIIKGSPHCYELHETELAQAVSSFILENK